MSDSVRLDLELTTDEVLVDADISGIISFADANTSSGFTIKVPANSNISITDPTKYGTFENCRFKLKDYDSAGTNITLQLNSVTTETFKIQPIFECSCTISNIKLINAHATSNFDVIIYPTTI